MSLNNMFVALLMFILVITPLPSLAQLNEFISYINGLKKIEAALPAYEEALVIIDVNKLSVSFKYGDLLEKNRSRSLKYIKMIHESISDIECLDL